MKIILVGTSWSGKTTLAKEIERTYGWLHIPEPPTIVGGFLMEWLKHHEHFLELTCDKYLEAERIIQETNMHIYKSLKGSVIADRTPFLFYAEHICQRDDILEAFRLKENKEIYSALSSSVEWLESIAKSVLEDTDAIFFVERMEFSQELQPLTARGGGNHSTARESQECKEHLLKACEHFGYSSVYTMPSASLEERMRIFDQTLIKTGK